MSTKTPLGRPLSVRVPEDLRERISALATATRRSEGDIVREVLERDLVRFEWEQRIAERAADLRGGREQTVPLVDLERELGIHGVPVDTAVADTIE